MTENKGVLPDGNLSNDAKFDRIDPEALEEFRRFRWAARAKYARSWLGSVLLFDLALIGFDWCMDPTSLWLSLIMRGGLVSLVLAAFYWLWGSYRPAAHEYSLVAIAIAAMTTAGVLGAHGADDLLERYLTAGFFTVGTATLFFPIGRTSTLAGLATAAGISAAFTLAYAPSATRSLMMLGFYAAAISCLAMARQEAHRGLWRSFTARIREKRAQNEMARMNAELQAAADIDMLTGISNRRALKKYLTALWSVPRASPSSIAFLMIDIDHFKSYNDTFGHSAGDLCLQSVSATIRDTLAERDIVARHGGEEFIVVLAQTSPADALISAERIRAAVAALKIANPQSSAGGVVTISIGVALAESLLTPEDLIKNADAALYRAKQRGRNQCALELPSAA